jgi:hypothetical protein
MLYFALFGTPSSVAQVGFDQYVYVKPSETMMLVPILNFEADNHMYVEARYNYEDLNTFSLYLGRTFSIGDIVAYSLTPLVGAVAGNFQGGSVGVNAMIEYNKIFFSSESQYTFSFRESSEDFLFAWSDLAYQPTKWFYAGLSTQQTILPQTKALNSEFGIALGFMVGKWSFPLYCFSPRGGRPYLVLGVSFSDTLRALNNK